MTAYTKMNTYLYQWFLVCFVEKNLLHYLHLLIYSDTVTLISNQTVTMVTNRQGMEDDRTN